MPHFRRFGYRFFALTALLVLAACFSNPPEEGVETEAAPAAQHTTSRPAPAAPEPPAPSPFGPPSGTAPAAPDSQYAPHSHLNNEEVAAVAQGGYAPPSHIGEESKAVTVKVGLLIPMSGESTALGKSLLDAAVLAIYDKYSALSPRDITAKVELIPMDTGDSIEGAEKAAQDAIKQGATLLLGPVFSKQVTAVASIARGKDIPVITFSNNVAVEGNGVYLFGFIPEQQVVRIVQYALSQKVSNIAALVPSNPYGAAIVKQLSTEVRKTGGRAHPIEYYPEDMESLEINVGRLARFLQDENTKGEALFIAEGSEKLKKLTDTLAAHGIAPANVQLLGTGLWDDPEITRWPNVQGGWFASSPPEKYQAFEQHFLATYGYKPERRASLSYDAVALAATMAIASKGEGFPKSTITDPVGFSGPANGIFRFHDDGSIERGLSVLMVTPGGFTTIAPAPTIFDQ